jgi:hypothetical protein
MRRMVKENLLKFDGTPLFPERIAYTVPYKLSEPEAASLQGGHRVCARGVQPRRGAAERQARRHGRLRPDHPAAPARLLARGHLPVAAARREGGSRAACGSWSCCREVQLPRRTSPDAPVLDPRTSKTSKTRPTTRSKRPRPRSSTRRQPQARSIDELKIEIATLKRLEALAQTVRRSGEDTQVARARAPLSEIFRSGSGASIAAEGARIRRQARRRPQVLAPPEAGHLHRASRHPELPHSAHHRRCWAALEPLSSSMADGPRGAQEGPGGLQARP